MHAGAAVAVHAAMSVHAFAAHFHRAEFGLLVGSEGLYECGLGFGVRCDALGGQVADGGGGLLDAGRIDEG